jgi:glycyl-tRNA synthetase beta chain
MPDLLFEIGTEELPSWYVSRARESIGPLLDKKLVKEQVSHGEVRSYATPRRIAVWVADIADRSQERNQEVRGPTEEIAFDHQGQPTRAALGFASANGVDVSDLIVKDTARGRYVYALKVVGGVAASELLPGVLASVVSDLPAPRKMRWSDVAEPFVRPVSWLLALLGDEALPVQAAGCSADRITYGHRFLAPEALTLTSPDRYVATLREGRVLADCEERRLLTWKVAMAVAGSQDLKIYDQPALLEEVSNLVEYPHAILGRFDQSYLALPEEVLTTVMIQHQRFFPTRYESGRLAPFFVGVSNNKVPDEGLVRAGYEQVLAGRLYDARFFWDSDRKKSLSQHAWGLSGIGFQKQLGSMADKVSRVGETSRLLAETLHMTREEREVLDQALPIFRADLSTEMVYEFPDLEGVMARAYALAEGLEAAVAEVLEQGVMPMQPGGPLPTSRVGALLSITDRVDKLVGFFALGKRPTGSTDPFGLRRDAVAVARTLNSVGWHMPLTDFVEAAVASYRSSDIDIAAAVVGEVNDFIWDRVASLLVDEGVRITVVRAATADTPPIITASRRAHLLRLLMQTQEFSDLLMLYKRAANLAKESTESREVDPSLFRDVSESPLFAALPDSQRGMEKLLATVRRSLSPWDLGRSPGGSIPEIDAALKQVLSLKEPLDAFLDNVLVMVEEGAVRENRLALLCGVRDALRLLGGLDKLEGV